MVRASDGALACAYAGGAGSARRRGTAGAGVSRSSVVEAGVTSILNFAPVVLSVPDKVEVRKVDLSIELQILAFHEQRKAGGPMADQVAAGDFRSLHGGEPSESAPYVEAVDA